MNRALDKKTVWLAAILLLLLLMSMGIVYGHWNKTFSTHGTIMTGAMDANWLEANCHEINSLSGEEIHSTTMSHTIAREAVVISTEKSFLTLAMNNTYPGYSVKCQVFYQNTGTVPWRVSGVSLENSSHLTGCHVVSTGEGTTLSCDQIEVDFLDNVKSLTISPGESYGSQFIVRVTDQAAEAQTGEEEYRFAIQFCLTNAFEDLIISCGNPDNS